MFDPEFETIVRNLCASKDVIKHSDLSYEYKNQHIKIFIDTLKYFYGKGIDDKLLDVLYHDAFKLVFESQNDIRPALEKDGYVDAYVFKNNNDPIYGHMTKRIATDDNYNAANLIYINDDIMREYKFYEDNLMMSMIINDNLYIKVAHVNAEGNIEYAVFKDNKEEQSRTFILRTDSYNIKDVIDAYMEMNRDEDIKLLFPELFERSPYTLPSRTRK